MRRGDARGIGAGAEEGRVPERRDTAIAGDEIERQHQQSGCDDPGQKSQIVGKEEVADHRDQQDNGQTYEVPTAKPSAHRSGRDQVVRRRHGHPLALPASPRGNTQMIAITAR
ncbi:hypothetical protein D3C71_1905170 [compost metagenome]